MTYKTEQEHASSTVLSLNEKKRKETKITIHKILVSIDI